MLMFTLVIFCLTNSNLPESFRHSSIDKECTCNAWDPDSIPGLGRSSGEGKGYTLQYFFLENSMDCIIHGVGKSQTWLNDFHFRTIFRASLIAQLENNLPAMQEIGVWFFGKEDPLEKKMATHSSTVAWRIPCTEESGRLQSMGSQESDTT